MANTLLTPSIIARETLANLVDLGVLIRLVHRDYSADFAGKQGDTITVRKPASFTAQEFSRPAGITVQDATETGVSVTLDKVPDVSFAVTAEELTLDVVDFAAQFLRPAAEAIGEYLEGLIAAELETAVQTVGPPGTVPADVLIPARKTLNDNKVAASDRHVALSTQMAADWLADTLFHQADQRGDTDGLREASIGRKFGFDNWESTHMAGDDSVAFHRTAVALVTRTPMPPAGIAPNQVAVVDYEGIGLRVVQAYDTNQKQDVISVDLLAGVATLDANRMVIIDHAV